MQEKWSIQEERMIQEKRSIQEERLIQAEIAEVQLAVQVALTATTR
jgi:hypothetical protein